MDIDIDWGDVLGDGIKSIGNMAGSALGGLLGGSGGQSVNVTRSLQLAEQYFAYQNAMLQYYNQMGLNSQAFGFNKDLQSSAFGFDKDLQKYSWQLAQKSADKDYQRSLKYITDSVARNKSALLANGYNPMLALSSSMPSYSGHTNSASAPSVSASGVSSGSAAMPHGTAHSAPNHVNNRIAAMSAMSSALSSFGRMSSEIEVNEATAAKEKALANKAVSEQKQIETDIADEGVQKRNKYTVSQTINKHSDTANKVIDAGKQILGNGNPNHYVNTESIFGSANTAKQAKAVGDAAKKVEQNPTDENVVDLLKDVPGNPAAKGNSAHIGSRLLQAALAIGTAATASAVGNKGMKDARKDVKPDDKGSYQKSYDKWRRVYFPMTGGF